MRAPCVPQYRYRLADLDRERCTARTPKICDHQQDGDGGAAIHAQDQRLEDRCCGGCRYVCVQATFRRDQSRSGFRRHGGIRRSPTRYTFGSKEMISPRKVIMVAAALTAFAAGLSWQGGSIATNGVFSEAQARVGRPLTPMSYAGVARRTTRRAVAVGAAAGAAGAYYGSACAQVVDPYGQVTTRC